MPACRCQQPLGPKESACQAGHTGTVAPTAQGGLARLSNQDKTGLPSIRLVGAVPYLHDLHLTCRSRLLKSPIRTRGTAVLSNRSDRDGTSSSLAAKRLLACDGLIQFHSTVQSAVTSARNTTCSIDPFSSFWMLSKSGSIWYATFFARFSGLLV